MKKIGNWYTGGEKRTRRVFLLLPRTEYHRSHTEGESQQWKETRWLEWATIEEAYHDYTGDGGRWMFEGFVEEGL